MKLLPCVRCGKVPNIILDSLNEWKTECDCEVSVWTYTQESLIREWNRRNKVVCDFKKEM